MNRIKLLRITILFFFFLYKGEVYSQEVYQFTKGLVAEINIHYGREAIYEDSLAYLLYTHTLATPVPGKLPGVSDKGPSIFWQPIIADTSYRFITRDTGMERNYGKMGYLYLTYISDREKTALLNVRGNSSLYFNGVLHAGDPYSSGWLYIPVRLKKGPNELYVRGIMSVTASLHFPLKPVLLNSEDPTLPAIVLNKQMEELQGSVVVINTSSKELKGLQLKSDLQGKEVISVLPSIPPMSTRKVPFRFDADNIVKTGKYECVITLIDKGKILDEKIVGLDAVSPTDKYSITFTSAIDGSVQYYAVTPQPIFKSGSALFLSVHGAGVEAIGQAKAYKPKDWGTLVAATNRRPRGFNWEDWGRLDALEVLKLAKEKFLPDPQHIYLTGHSMGGHGTWFLGATYPDKWAAIAPCSGYPTLKGYGSADGLIPENSSSPLEQILLRAGNQSDVIKLTSNYKPEGVYILHGDSDHVVSVNYARQMRKTLGDFHSDMSYYEYPGGEHWFGDQSVDWEPIFNFFKWHRLAVDSTVNTIDFKTASPGISSGFHWASVQQQVYPLNYSRIQLSRDLTDKTLTGITENVRVLKLGLSSFGSNTFVKINLDHSTIINYRTTSLDDSIYLLHDNDKWQLSSRPDLSQKGPLRYGTFKDAFNNHMIFVYGTMGTKEENEWNVNKARYDQETWYYRGNGAVEVISDKEFSMEKYKDRGVILYGNKSTNSAWNSLLKDCPIQVERNKIIAGNKSWQGDDLAAYFVWPIHSSAIASVAVICGTGARGMNAANANQYFAGASGFPDFMIFTLNMLKDGAKEVKMAGFFDYNWKLDSANMVTTE